VIALLQRVTHARVTVHGQIVGEIGPGLLALVGVQADDVSVNARRLAERVVNYRVFADEAGKMNLCLRDTDGGLLLVPQFTLAADTRKGNRPSFSSAAQPEQAQRLFEEVVAAARAFHPRVATGQFGAEMYVALENHGPVTFWLDA
jgi:D-aminoacyl-tRNA deacylase